MACSANQYAQDDDAQSSTDGCQNCPYKDGVQSTSAGGDATSCTCPKGSQFYLHPTSFLGTSCNDQNCPTDTQVAMTGATTETEGCAACPVGATSNGGTATSCICPTSTYLDSSNSCAFMNCAENQMATPVSGGATQDTQGCKSCWSQQNKPQVSLGGPAIECYCPPERTNQSLCAWKCEVGYYNANPDTGECLPMKCPENMYATSEQATQNTEGCEQCQDQISPGGSATSCVDDNSINSSVVIIIIIVVVVILVLLAAAAAQYFLVLSKSEEAGANNQIDYEVEKEKV